MFCTQPIAIAAAKAGKMVWCEKPLATSLAEAEAMAEAARQVPNLVWYNYRRIPAVAFAKRLIEQGRLGQTFHYRALYLNQSGNNPAKANTWRYRRAEAGTGAAGDLLSHSVDSALYLTAQSRSDRDDPYFLFLAVTSMTQRTSCTLCQRQRGHFRSHPLRSR